MVYVQETVLSASVKPWLDLVGCRLCSSPPKQPICGYAIAVKEVGEGGRKCIGRNEHRRTELKNHGDYKLAFLYCRFTEDITCAVKNVSTVPDDVKKRDVIS